VRLSYLNKGILLTYLNLQRPATPYVSNMDRPSWNTKLQQSLAGSLSLNKCCQRAR